VSDPASATIERTEAASADSAATSSAPAKPTRQRKTPGQPKEKKLSALDGAAQVLAEEGRAMTCQEMIDVMAAKDYWTSPQWGDAAGHPVFRHPSRTEHQGQCRSI
jgi:hypothetical protein